MMFSLSSVGGSKSAERGPYPLEDLDRGGPYLLTNLDRGVHIYWRIWTEGPNPLGHRQTIQFKPKITEKVYN